MGEGYLKVMVFLCYWAACAFVVSFLTPMLSPRQLKKRIPVLERMFAPPMLELAAAIALGGLTQLVPHTLDYYLYAFDGSLGYQFGFLAGEALAKSNLLRLAAEFAYINLTLAMAFLYLCQSEREARSFLMLIGLIAVVGFGLFVVFPAAGTRVIFPHEFPLSPPATANVAIQQTPLVTEPRNCMPSLHTAWGLALWWMCPRKRWLRFAVGFYLFFMLLYTLASGHYLVDMIAAVPFTLALYAFTKSGDLKRAGTAMAMFLGWLVLLRFASDAFLASPVTPWALTIATLLACRAIRLRVDATSHNVASGSFLVTEARPAETST